MEKSNPLDDFQRDANSQHDPMHHLELLFIFYDVCYVTNGFNREMLHCFHFSLQLFQFMQPYLPLTDFLAEQRFLLFQKKINDIFRMSFSKSLGDRIDWKIQFS